MVRELVQKIRQTSAVSLFSQWMTDKYVEGLIARRFLEKVKLINDK